jgi:hypothetical protein
MIRDGGGPRGFANGGEVQSLVHQVGGDLLAWATDGGRTILSWHELDKEPNSMFRAHW